MTNLAREIVEYIRGERGPVNIDIVVGYIMRDAATGCGWSKATEYQWLNAITEAVSAGALVMEGKLVRLAPPVKAKPVAKQMELF